MRIRVIGDLDDLEADLTRIATTAKADMRKTVVNGVRVGALAGRRIATPSSGRHGRHYPKSITPEMTGALMGEWGPDSSMLQGGMSFEFGSRNQPPHLDIAKSGDLAIPAWQREVADLPDEWFW